MTIKMKRGPGTTPLADGQPGFNTDENSFWVGWLGTNYRIGPPTEYSGPMAGMPTLRPGFFGWADDAGRLYYGTADGNVFIGPCCDPEPFAVEFEAFAGGVAGASAEGEAVGSPPSPPSVVEFEAFAGGVAAGFADVYRGHIVSEFEAFAGGVAGARADGYRSHDVVEREAFAGGVGRAFGEGVDASARRSTALQTNATGLGSDTWTHAGTTLSGYVVLAVAYDSDDHPLSGISWGAANFSSNSITQGTGITLEVWILDVDAADTHDLVLTFGNAKNNLSIIVQTIAHGLPYIQTGLQTGTGNSADADTGSADQDLFPGCVMVFAVTDSDLTGETTAWSYGTGGGLDAQTGLSFAWAGENTTAIGTYQSHFTFDNATNWVACVFIPQFS